MTLTTSSVAERETFALIWKPTYVGRNGKDLKKHVVGESREPIEVLRRFDIGAKDQEAAAKKLYYPGDTIKYVKRGHNKTIPVKVDGALQPSKNIDYLETFLNLAQDTILYLPLNSNIIRSREYSPQAPNRIVQYQTLSGTSVTTFGSGVKKIALKVQIIKAGKLWVPYAAALEALAEVSGNGYRYNGSLFLQGFDQSKTTNARRYKVVIESVSNSTSADMNNVISYDINFLVTYDYSASRLGTWGKL